MELKITPSVDFVDSSLKEGAISNCQQLTAIKYKHIRDDVGIVPYFSLFTFYSSLFTNRKPAGMETCPYKITDSEKQKIWGHFLPPKFYFII